MSSFLQKQSIFSGTMGTGRPRIKQFFCEDKRDCSHRLGGQADLRGINEEAKKEITRSVRNEEPFDTPKPEKLLQRIVDIATKPGDWVLDSFAGSGTTGAVAHKMGRRWIMVELGEHCHTHIIPRLKKVIDGTDQGGITKAVGWKGGGGFRYFRLAPSLLEKDKWGNWVINKDYNAAMLAEAVCKLEGFIYAPSDTVYWQHGYSTERDFIYVTTQTLRHDQLQQLSDEVGEHRSLLVMCAAFRGKPERIRTSPSRRFPRPSSPAANGAMTITASRWKTSPRPLCNQDRGTLELVQEGGH